MKDRDEFERLEKIMGQLRGLHDETSLLARKSANDGVNAFKLINKVLATETRFLDRPIGRSVISSRSTPTTFPRQAT